MVSELPPCVFIFPDGVEADGLYFNSGAIASVGIARERANLVEV
jgi:hypothetical protein